MTAAMILCLVWTYKWTPWGFTHIFNYLNHTLMSPSLPTPSPYLFTAITRRNFSCNILAPHWVSFLFNSIIPWLYPKCLLLCVCVHVYVCVSVWSLHSGQWHLGHHGQCSSTPLEEVRKCLARGSDKVSHPSFLSLRISTPYNILPWRADPTLRCMETGEQNDLWWHKHPLPPSPPPTTTDSRQEAGNENRKWNTYGVTRRLSDKSAVTNKNRDKKSRRKGRAGWAGGAHEPRGIKWKMVKKKKKSRWKRH